MNIFQRISLFWKAFTPLEDFLLNHLLNNIDTDLKNITAHQINSITKTQRLLDWSEINYYCSKFDEKFKYPNTNEIILAVIYFRVKGENKKYKSKISLQAHLNRARMYMDQGKFVQLKAMMQYLPAPARTMYTICLLYTSRCV